MSKRVFIGLSGGVDSSVAAYLLLQQGYDVEAVFMKNWQDDDIEGQCQAENDLSDALAVCHTLGIKLHTVNFAKEYWDRVFRHFLNEYQKGRTPNPDILCNKEIKFKAFLDYCLELGAELIATGHYAKSRIHNGKAQLLKAKDRSKDQSYFLYAVNQKALAKTLFPVGELLKTEIRDIAKREHLITHNKKDSTGICFIGEKKFKSFLSEYLLAQQGDMVTPTGETVGKHDGLMFYTIGQRQGLQIGGLKNAPELPWYVVDKDIDNNRLIVAQGDTPLLNANGLLASNADWISGKAPEFPLECTVKTRYRQEDIPALVTKTNDNEYCVMFASPVRAITPGQSVVFYQGLVCLGGAIIDKPIR